MEKKRTLIGAALALVSSIIPAGNTAAGEHVVRDALPN